MFLVTVTSLSLFFFMLSSGRRIDEWILTSMLHRSILPFLNVSSFHIISWHFVVLYLLRQFLFDGLLGLGWSDLWSSILACISWRHLFIWIASISLIEVNFLNQYPCIPSWPSVLQFSTFLSVALNESRGIFALGPSSSSCSYFSLLFIHSAFLQWSLGFHILFQNCVALFGSYC